MSFFRMLPGTIAALVAGHIMTALLLIVLGGSAAWIVTLITYQQHTRKAAERAAQDRRLPGSFPGDQN